MPVTFLASKRSKDREQNLGKVWTSPAWALLYQVEAEMTEVQHIASDRLISKVLPKLDLKNYFCQSAPVFFYCLSLPLSCILVKLKVSCQRQSDQLGRGAKKKRGKA